jgi:uncharacterized protein
MAIVVSDTSPLRALAHLQRMDILKALFQEVFIPPAVAQELRHPVPRFRPINPDDFDFIHTAAPSAQSIAKIPATAKLDFGETEALALALDRHADFLCIDERRGRIAAIQLGMIPVGVIGILTRAKEKSLIDSVAPSLRRLRTELGFFIDPKLEATTLALLGESPL